MADLDLILARKLQEEFDKETASQLTSVDRNLGSIGAGKALSSQSLSVVDPTWETTDPNPDVRALFLQFNDQYFWGRLAGVEVKWSPRMTLCAGVCSYEGRGGLCSIRLSVPLLKLRPRKDLVETLLHEMIHAFLFVTENDRDRDGHGPNFQKHMHRLNKDTGSNITIYHDFHDEVDSYRQHWWRCDGPCKSRPPYFGFVKRAMNRAPSPQDFWWGEHVKSCGGTYTKVKEPEGYGEKKKGAKDEKKKEGKAEQTSPDMDIRSFFGKGNMLGGSSQDNKPSASSGVSKKTASTVTSTDTTTGKTVGGTRPKNDEGPALPFDVEQWTGGIWTPEKNSTSHSASDADPGSTDNRLIDNNSHSREDTKGPGRKKNWTVVGTKNDNEMKPNAGANGDSEQPNSPGHVLGTSSGSSLSLLARLRKDWASSDSGNTAKPSTFSARQHTATSASRSDHKSQASTSGGKTKSQPEAAASTTGGETKSQPEAAASTSGTITATATKPSEQNEAVYFSMSDSSLQDSFYVSSCEEDNWPTPEKYRMKNKTNSVCQTKRKRTALDSVSSDEEECVVPTALKRAKQQGTSSDTQASDSDNVFSRVKAKNQSPSKSKKDLPTDPLENNSAVNATHTDKGKQNGAFSSSPPQSTSVQTGASVRVGATAQNAAGSSFVDCPSCQEQVPSDRINDHLDMCLS